MTTAPCHRCTNGWFGLSLNPPTQRARERFFNQPSIVQSIIQRVARQVKFSSPISKGQRFSIISYQFVPTAVIGLLNRGGPSAIRRFIITRIVNPIKTMFRRGAQAHIGKEGDKFSPAIADSNSPAAVVAVVGVFWARTASDHVFPSSVFGRIFPAVRLADVPTRYGSSTLQTYYDTCSPHNAYLAATAQAFPAAAANILTHRKWAKNLACNVFGSAEFSSRIGLHLTNLLQRFLVGCRAAGSHNFAAALF